MQSTKNSKNIQDIEEAKKPITELSYNGKSYKLRKFGFKTFTGPANRLYEAYQTFCADFGGDLQSEIQKEVIKRPELLSLIGLTQSIDDVKKLNKKQIMNLYNLLVKEDDFLIKTLQYQAKNERAKEIFLTTGMYGKQICDSLFENCDIDHSDEALDKLCKEEFDKYITFMKSCLDFFLKLL